MITNTGKGIIGKYLLGQAPAYASYIAIGCGPTPLNTNDTSADFSLKKNLEFEMFRVPISSRGFVNENGVDKIVFTVWNANGEKEIFLGNLKIIAFND